MINRNLIPRNIRERQSRDRSFHALADMRHGFSISQAARLNGITARTIKRYIGSQLQQDRPGARIRATKSDRLTRYMQIPGHDGSAEIKIRGSKAASEVARYKGAINRLLRGDRDAMAEWRGKRIGGIELITDERTLIDQAENDTLPYSLYTALAGVTA